MNRPRRTPKKKLVARRTKPARRTGPVRSGGRPSLDVPGLGTYRLSARCEKIVNDALVMHCAEHDISRTAAIRKAVRALVAKSLNTIADQLALASKASK